MVAWLEKLRSYFKNLFKKEEETKPIEEEKEFKPIEDTVIIKPELKSKPKAKPKPKIKKGRRVTRKRRIRKKKVLYPDSMTNKIISISPDLTSEKKLSEEEIKETVSTKIDDMVKMLEKGPKDFSTLSKSLGIPQTLVEEWAKILEEHNFVEITYIPMGSPVVKLKVQKAS